ncbi:TPA: hypothetical protein U1B91_000248 [Streptococcus suis]|nr:hypothetical protein [Streptococcus suis]
MKYTLKDRFNTLSTKGKLGLGAAGLSLALVIGGTVIWAMPKEVTTTKATQVQTTTTSSSDAQKDALKKATEAVEKLEKSPTDDLVKAAEKLVTALKVGKDKEALEGRLTKVKDALATKKAQETALQEAKRLVEAYEGNQVAENHGPAQTAVDKVADKKAKEELQNRINLVSQAIAQREAEAQAQAQAQAAQEAAQATAYQESYTQDTGSNWAPAQTQAQESYTPYTPPAQSQETSSDRQTLWSGNASSEEIINQMDADLREFSNSPVEDWMWGH